MSYMFFDATIFNQNISLCNTKSCSNFNSMFTNSGFNSDINNWNVSKVTSANAMFMNTIF